jgi:CheY-like chemotaxis protein
MESNYFPVLAAPPTDSVLPRDLALFISAEYLLENFFQGLEHVRNENYDLILLDLAMPEFSGHDVIRSLKEDGGLESRNIVVFTASSNRTLLDELKNMGIKEVFRKPCSLNELAELIEKYRRST